ncbi:hypothetical protein ACIG47_22185 [Promicromonospora sp. NPDC052451]|uniref:hypothetical protein n=1 Tax=unclassified Promicromonospora TaxID=2647929 RepID=UPI0037C9E83C
MIRATAPVAPSRPTARSARTRRAGTLSLLLTALLALAGTAVGGTTATAEVSGDEIWVSVDGVAFEPGRESDELAYVVRPVGSRYGGQAYDRDLTRDEQRSGWAAFTEARRSFPDGYCVVWVEVEDASSWHESDEQAVCSATEPAESTEPTSTPTPTATKTRPTQAATPRPGAGQPGSTPTPVTSDPAEAEPSSPAPTPSASPSPSPSASPSASASPSPSPSPTALSGALMPSIPPQSPVRARVDAGQEQEVVTPLGWVAVLATGAALTAGGLLMLWRRLT